ncbi:hypothetical protein KP509_05G057500 [Ceratopteris richardii]|uniref:Inositol polyphosphate-related phosphatase domain-containing protein n=1 Tax=Ceratopteris richardii TaxID=49495 RepID=A0A8T2UUM8_CERRI|nr:hypothetical protein KP509_05G057500 [Ceratopteris richardii]
MSVTADMQSQSKKRGELLWPRLMMKKWLNIQSTGDEFSADEFSADEHDDTDTENESDSEWESEALKPKVPRRHTTRNFSPSKLKKGGKDEERSRSRLGNAGRQPEFLGRQHFDTMELRIAIGTWNVAGRAPPPCLDLKNWLDMNNPSDIYVLGFQEVVPLNAGNVFGTEDNRPTLKWQTLIRETLNRANSKDCTCYSAPPSPSRETDSVTMDDLSEEPEMDSKCVLLEEETSIIPLDLCRSRSREQDGLAKSGYKQDLRSVYRCTERIGIDRVHHQRTNSEPINWLSAFDFPLDGGESGKDTVVRPLLSPISSTKKTHSKRIRYVRVASKQMVGIHVSVWVRRKLRGFIRNLTVSCVGLGIMGCLGNKGSISVSMVLHETSFCFICTHLSSGEKEGAELQRNADVVEILKRTRFPSTKHFNTNVPTTIYGHDRIIWFGDLNYRLNMSNNNARFLVSREDWTALLLKDQLKKELSEGQTFDGWHEGNICFPPTYKYVIDSDRYVGDANSKHGEKRRVPAWCDRILWHGNGLRQLSYRREELRHSDHRPVIGIFLAEVKVFNEKKLSKGSLFKDAKVEVEELLWKVTGYPKPNGQIFYDQI